MPNVHVHPGTYDAPHVDLPAPAKALKLLGEGGTAGPYALGAVAERSSTDETDAAGHGLKPPTPAGGLRAAGGFAPRSPLRQEEEAPLPRRNSESCRMEEEEEE